MSSDHSGPYDGNIAEGTASYTHSRMASKSVAGLMDEVQQYEYLYNQFSRDYNNYEYVKVN